MNNKQNTSKYKFSSFLYVLILLLLFTYIFYISFSEGVFNFGYRGYNYDMSFESNPFIFSLFIVVNLIVIFY